MSYVRDIAECNQNRLESNKYWLHSLGLHFFQLDKIKWKNFHNYIVNELWADLNIKPDIGQAYGDLFGYSNDAIAYEILEEKLEACAYQNLENCSFGYLSPSSILKKENKENFCHSGIYTYFEKKYDKEPDLHRSNVKFILEDNIKPFNFEYYTKIANKLHELSGAVYGYYFYHPQNCKAEFFINGFDYLSTNLDEYDRNIKWLHMRYKIGDDIVNYLRDIFRINFLSPHHLELLIDNAGTKLGDWISKGTESSRGVLGQLSKDFYYWYVEDASLQVEIRNQLAPSGRIICIEDKI